MLNIDTSFILRRKVIKNNNLIKISNIKAK